MKLTVEIQAVFSVVEKNGTQQRPMEPKALTSHCSDVMDELVKLEESGCGIDSPAVSVDTTLGQVEIELRAQGETFEDAQRMGLLSMRTAIHAAGGATPDWLNLRSSNAELVSA